MIKSSNEYLDQAEPFIQRLARSFEQRGLVGEHKAVTRDDLIQVGRVATWRASQKYDPARGVKFFTYAFPAIWQAITAEVHRMGDSVRLPAAMHWSVIRHVARTIEEMTNQLGRQPTLDEVVHLHSQIKTKTTKELNRDVVMEAYLYLGGNREISLDDMEEYENGDLQEFRNTPGDFVLEEEVERDAFREYVGDVMVEVLSQRELRVLRLRMGFEDSRPRTFREAADELGLTPEGVRQVEGVALEKLRTHPRSRGLRQLWS